MAEKRPIVAPHSVGKSTFFLGGGGLWNFDIIF